MPDSWEVIFIWSPTININWFNYQVLNTINEIKSKLDSLTKAVIIINSALLTESESWKCSELVSLVNVVRDYVKENSKKVLFILAIPNWGSKNAQISSSIKQLFDDSWDDEFKDLTWQSWQQIAAASYAFLGKALINL